MQYNATSTAHSTVTEHSLTHTHTHTRNDSIDIQKCSTNTIHLVQIAISILLVLRKTVRIYFAFYKTKQQSV